MTPYRFARARCKPSESCRHVREFAALPAERHTNQFAARIVTLWNVRVARGAEPLFIPTISASIRAGRPRATIGAISQSNIAARYYATERRTNCGRESLDACGSQMSPRGRAKPSSHSDYQRSRVVAGGQLSSVRTWRKYMDGELTREGSPRCSSLEHQGAYRIAVAAGYWRHRRSAMIAASPIQEMRRG